MLTVERAQRWTGKLMNNLDIKQLSLTENVSKPVPTHRFQYIDNRHPDEWVKWWVKRYGWNRCAVNRATKIDFDTETVETSIFYVVCRRWRRCHMSYTHRIFAGTGFRTKRLLNELWLPANATKTKPMCMLVASHTDTGTGRKWTICVWIMQAVFVNWWNGYPVINPI